MLLASLGLHALLLLLPIGGEEQVKKEPKKIDEKPVKVTQLARPKATPTPQAKPKPTSRPTLAQSPALKRAAVSPAPVLEVKQTLRPSPSPQPVEAEEVNKVEPAERKAEPQPTSTNTPTPTPTNTPTPTPTPDESGVDPVTQNFAAPLGTLSNEVDAPGGTGELTKEFLWKQEIPAAPEDFKDPSPFFEDIAARKGKPGVATYVYLSPVRDDAETFYTAQLKGIYETNGFTVEKKGEFGGGPVYEVKKDDQARYFNIVPGGSKAAGSGDFQQTGLIVVIWKQSPI